ncbi:hypothetical protein NA56DRAFT_651603 [Hyaloscypha hepaticicola]|uniref:Secreted protein n=1 Tax=Hyaloscypha hepaticicola TaxID=2082293 RepID=A0A2J6PHY9_9HELO|nr:hypothetical protein NA56DRAFT_651603 [Hyaloscypha hepaticicola]
MHSILLLEAIMVLSSDIACLRPELPHRSDDNYGAGPSVRLKSRSVGFQHFHRGKQWQSGCYLSVAYPHWHSWMNAEAQDSGHTV